MHTAPVSRRRRFAAALAVLGVLTLSSGAALMAAAAPAQAAPAAPAAPAKPDLHLGVKVCHANAGNSDADPYDYEVVSIVDSIIHSAFHRTGGLGQKTWSSDGTWNGTWHDAGDPRPDYVYPLDPNFTEAWCEAETFAPVEADVTWIEPTCRNGNEAGYETSGEHVTWSVASGSADPGASIELTATADDGYRFADDQGSQTFEHTFDEAEDCTEYDATAEITWVEPDCENQNTAGFTPTGDAFVTYAVTDGTIGPGQTVTVTATADEGHAFANESTTKVFEHTFDPAEICDIVLPPDEVTPGAPTFDEPTCDVAPAVVLPEPSEGEEQPPVILDGRQADLIDTQDVDGVQYVVTGDLEAGGTVDVHATALPGYAIAEGATAHWTHTFAMPEGCPTVVAPPTAEPTVLPTVVSSGIAEMGAVVDPRGEQGLVLLTAGMVLLVLAAGLGLSPNDARRR